MNKIKEKAGEPVRLFAGNGTHQQDGKQAKEEIRNPHSQSYWQGGGVGKIFGGGEQDIIDQEKAQGDQEAGGAAAWSTSEKRERQADNGEDKAADW